MTQENKEEIQKGSFEEFAKLNNDFLKFKPSKAYKYVKLAPVLGAFNAQFKENKELFTEDFLKEIDTVSENVKNMAAEEWKEAQKEVNDFLTKLVLRIVGFQAKEGMEVSESDIQKFALKVKAFLAVIGAELDAETVFYAVKAFYLD